MKKDRCPRFSKTGSKTIYRFSLDLLFFVQGGESQFLGGVKESKFKNLHNAKLHTSRDQNEGEKKGIFFKVMKENLSKEKEREKKETDR